MHPGRIVTAPLRMAFQWIGMRLAEKRVVHGLVVADMRLDDADGPAFGRAIEAVELIHRHDPARLRRLARDVRCLIVAPTMASGGEYRENMRAVLLNAENVSRQRTEAIAMIIVHEATHARLWRRSVGRFPDTGRIERACVEAEIRFARKVPGTEPLIEGARRKLASRYWEQPQDAAMANYGAKLGVPRWLWRLLLRK